MAAVTSAASAAVARFGASMSDAQYFESSMVRVEDIRRQLDSKSVKDKLDAMKRVIALISLGKDASTFFPDVVKNVIAPSLDVKKLVYVYLVHYAEEKQDLALLAINTFQKDLSDHNQHIRALSLRVLSSIRVKVILQVVILAIGRAAKDSSSYVRKAAAHAISKVCALDVTSKEMLLDPLKDLLSDLSPQVIGSAVAAYEEVCPYDWDLIHPHYRRYCKNLGSMDPWGHVAVVPLLLRYARTHFAKPNSKNGPRNSDLDLLLTSVTPLLYSMNAATVGTAIATFYHLGTSEEFCTFAIKPLMRLVALRSDASQAVALNIAAAVAAKYPSVLIPYVSEFYVSAAHSPTVRNLRIKVLMRICATAGKAGGIGSKPHARRALLAELREYLHRRENNLAASAARAIGCLATAHPESTPAIVRVLSSVVSSTSNSAVVTESIGVLRRLLQRHPSAQAKALPQLIAMLLADNKKKTKESMKEPAARASIIWLIAEFYEKVPTVAAEALRLLARGFADEAAEVKLQILNLAAKIVTSAEFIEETAHKGQTVVPIKKSRQLLVYVLACARYDRDYDVRDKARMLNYIFFSEKGKVLRRHVCLSLLAKKPISSAADDGDVANLVEEDLEPDMVIGSLAHVLRGRRLAGFRPLEPWASRDSDASLREQTSADSGNSASLRDYVGVSSTDYQGYVSPTITAISSETWRPSATSSSQMIGNNVSPMSGVGAQGTALSLPHNQLYQNTSTGRTVNMDPERFYDEESEDSSCDDDDDESYDSSCEGEEEVDGGDEETTNPVVRRSGKSGSQDAASSPRHMKKSALLIDTDEVEPDALERGKGKPLLHVSNEYDLDELLGELTFSTNTSENKSSQSPTLGGMGGSPSVMQQRTEFQRVMESWNACGLQVDAAYVRKVSTENTDVTPIVLQVSNIGKNVVTGIGFLSQCGNRFECSRTILRLQPEESAEVQAVARFRGKTSGVRFGLTVENKVVGSGEFKPSTGYVIRPHPNITPHGFAEAEKQLKGMLSSEASFQLAEPKGNDWIGLSKEIEKCLLNTCFISHIKTSIGSDSADSSEKFSSMFAGYMPGEGANTLENPVLLRVTVNSKSDHAYCTCKLWIGCEKVLLSANLLQLCKGSLSLKYG
ncbi:AP-3 complex subunit beta-1 [Gracilariopsis chorda]|uniref:AP-3 complex subunit beta n=1 Tax=Gracilariopsis chorda TaxID=448386 RepID=A0A2V3J369_9FLOR|nr:AP-3 complex subunit beta-1 [Gracilariopsis chorda]|eukprot:PXF48835.1 AP-3 complex subunit beta-1 [Gracilariopsis chorda]